MSLLIHHWSLVAVGTRNHSSFFVHVCVYVCARGYKCNTYWQLKRALPHSQWAQHLWCMLSRNTRTTGYLRNIYFVFSAMKKICEYFNHGFVNAEDHTQICQQKQNSRIAGVRGFNSHHCEAYHFSSKYIMIDLFTLLQDFDSTKFLSIINSFPTWVTPTCITSEVIIVLFRPIRVLIPGDAHSKGRGDISYRGMASRL